VLKKTVTHGYRAAANNTVVKHFDTHRERRYCDPGQREAGGDANEQLLCRMKFSLDAPQKQIV